MRFVASTLIVAFSVVSTIASPALNIAPRYSNGTAVVKPKVFLIDMVSLAIKLNQYPSPVKFYLKFPPEGNVWYGIPEFNLLERNITVPGFSPLFPDAHCTANGDVCQLVTGESGK